MDCCLTNFSSVTWTEKQTQTFYSGIIPFVIERLNYYSNRDYSRTLCFQKRASNIQEYCAQFQHHAQSRGIVITYAIRSAPNSTIYNSSPQITDTAHFTTASWLPVRCNWWRILRKLQDQPDGSVIIAAGNNILCSY
jgi:hypothetical protein